MNLMQDFLGDLPLSLTVVYGGPATGKTLLCLTAVLYTVRQGKKVIFIDTEKGFFVERFQQLAGEDANKYLDQIILFRPTSFKGQHEQIMKLEQFIKQPNVGLLIVDTLGYYYRRLLKSKLLLANRMLITQVNTLRSYASRLPIIVTNQVYTDVETQEQKIVGGAILLRSGQRVIELQKDPRKIMLKQPQQQESLFTIDFDGFHF
ncbi:DNA repair protein RadB [Candidatus Woesearchaeota archaeon]|nr:DNA repair protein RadB [Candidatus Woesearchaeota archaeon]